MVDLNARAAAAAADDEAQLRYARLLDWGTRAGLAVLFVSFALYAFGVLPATVPPERLPTLWGQPLAQFLQASGAPTGWTWLRLIGHGDMLGLAGIALLAGCSGLCLVALLPLYRARGDRVYVALCVTQLLVLLLAASGLLAGGH